MKNKYLVVLAIAFTALGLGLGKIAPQKILAALDTQSAHAEKAAAPAAPAPVTDNLRDLFVELSKRLVPSVVNINTTQNVSGPYGGGQQAEIYRKFFEQFFGEDMGQGPNMPRQERKAQSLGTGFIIDEAEGLILTNYHVIADADEIKVILSEEDADKDGISAKVVGGDAEADVALLKIKTSKKLKAAPLGDSDALQVGDWVMAVGNPFGHGHTVTHGIISAKERIVPISQFANFLQTDAPINPGNSGGPLINAAGQVIGINSAINAAAQGIGFAIPINLVKKILPDLRTKGAVTRGFIGVNISEFTPQLVSSLKLKKDVRGVIVSEVFENEPAAKAGIQVYDVIQEINGKKINDGRQLIANISSYSPGTKINVKVLRAGKEKDISVTVGKRPSRDTMLGQKKAPRGSLNKSSLNLGMSVEDLDPELRRELGLPPSFNGVVISRVTPGGPAEASGFQRGDVIMDVDQKATPNVRSFNNIFKEERVYLIRFRREDNIAIAPLDLSKKADREPQSEGEE